MTLCTIGATPQSVDRVSDPLIMTDFLPHLNTRVLCPIQAVNAQRANSATRGGWLGWLVGGNHVNFPTLSSMAD